MVRRVLQDNKVPGTSMGTRVAAAPGWVPPGSAAVFLGESQVNGSLSCQTRFEHHQEGPGSLKLLGAIGMNWQTHRGSVHPLRLWMVAGESSFVTDPDLDSPWSGWRVGLSERPGACLEWQA